MNHSPFDHRFPNITRTRRPDGSIPSRRSRGRTRHPVASNDNLGDRERPVAARKDGHTWECSSNDRAVVKKVAARPTGRIAVRGKPVTIPQGAGSIPAIPTNSPWTPGGIAGRYGNVKRSPILQTGHGSIPRQCWCNIVARHGTVGWGKKS